MCVLLHAAQVWEVHRPTIADNGDPVAVSLCGLHRPATSAYSKEIPGKLLACCVSVRNASARRSRIILKGTWLTAQTVIGELSGLFIGIRAPRGYPDCLKTVPAVSVSNSYQRIFGYSDIRTIRPGLVRIPNGVTILKCWADKGFVGNVFDRLAAATQVSLQEA